MLSLINIFTPKNKALSYIMFMHDSLYAQTIKIYKNNKPYVSSSPAETLVFAISTILFSSPLKHIILAKQFGMHCNRTGWFINFFHKQIIHQWTSKIPTFFSAIEELKYMKSVLAYQSPKTRFVRITYRMVYYTCNIALVRCVNHHFITDLEQLHSLYHLVFRSQYDESQR